jgi:hypothetical protein
MSFHCPHHMTKCTRDIRKATSIYFWPLMLEQGRARACEVASHDSLACKPSHNCSPIVCSCLLLSDLWCVLRLIIPPAAVYGQNVISEGNVRQWCRMFKDGWTNVQDEERSGRPSVAGDDLVQVLTKKFPKDGTSQFQNFRVNFDTFHTLFSTRLSWIG